MNYQQLTDSQRYQIESYLKADYCITQIAKELCLFKSTIGREIKRNRKKMFTTFNMLIQLAMNEEGSLTSKSDC